MSKGVFATSAVPAAGPYSQAVGMKNFVFCSGQLPVDPQTGLLVATDIGAATEQTLKNLRTVLAAVGLDLEHVVKTTIYLTNTADFIAMNEAYGRYFTADFPARTTVVVAALPKGAPIEIEAIAVRP